MRHLTQLVLLLAIIPSTQALAVDLEVLWPQGRGAHQTNEWIALSVVRRGTQPLPATNLTMTVSGEDDSKLTFAFPLGADRLPPRVPQQSALSIDCMFVRK